MFVNWSEKQLLSFSARLHFDMRDMLKRRQYKA